MSFLNIYSFIIIAIAVIGLFILFFAWTGWNKRKVLALIALAAAFGLTWWGLRTGAGTTRDPGAAQLVIRQTETPVLIEFYSDFCVGCLAARITVDQLERDLKGQLTVVRLDVASGAGVSLSRQLKATGTPTFILFDAQGQEIWRTVGALNADEVRAALTGT
jgi:thiol:disulfide interchange protein